MLVNSPDKAKKLGVSDGVEVDFEDWSYLYFPDVDFHIGKSLGYTHYPFAKRNKAIEEKWQEVIKNGKSKEEALKEIQTDYEIDDTSVKILLGQKITSSDLELLYTSVENPIYEVLTDQQMIATYIIPKALAQNVRCKVSPTEGGWKINLTPREKKN